MEHKGKLELTWVGKYDDKVIEHIHEDAKMEEKENENMMIK